MNSRSDNLLKELCREKDRLEQEKNHLEEAYAEALSEDNVSLIEQLTKTARENADKLFRINNSLKSATRA